MDDSRSYDEASVCEEIASFDGYQDAEDDVCGLADAFQQFEARAEKRTQELLETTDRQLFQEPSTIGSKTTEDEEANAEEEHLPAYMYMSDQYRLKKPPQFQDWQQKFQYLHVTGSKLFEGESTEHIQLVPTEASSLSLSGYNGGGNETVLQVEGRSCLQEPTPESQEHYEEIILCDGEMEETLECHQDLDDDSGENLECGRLSPITAHVEEVLDALTVEYFSSTVAPKLTSFYKTMLEKQQQEVRAVREEREAVANRTIRQQLAAKKAQRLKLEQDALEEAARVEALEKARQEEELREAERRELLLKQQLEENDEEEIKVKTLAYTHTREWYQPNKKCFTHRGRQLTYLKPVLQQSKEPDEIVVIDSQKRSPPPIDDKRRSKRDRAQRPTVPQKPQPEWVTGGALTNDKLCDISWIKKIARPPSSPPHLDAHTNGLRRRRKNENQKEEVVPSNGVQLPAIGKAGAMQTTAPTGPAKVPTAKVPTAPADSVHSKRSPQVTRTPASKVRSRSPYLNSTRAVSVDHTRSSASTAM